MFKQIGTAITFLVLPVVLFALMYVGMTLFGSAVEISSEPPAQHMLSPKEPSDTCGNGICEKAERDDRSCTEDC